MAPDPYNCDVVFSILLLLTFCTTLPAILSVGMVDWVVAKGDHFIYEGQKTAEIGNISQQINVSAELKGRTADITRLNTSHENVWSPERITLIADFKYLCVISATERNCQLLNVFNNASLVPPSCLKINGSYKNVSLIALDVLKCNSFRLSRAILEAPVFLSVFPVVAVILTVTTTLIIDLIAVFGKASQASNIFLGFVLFAAGAVQIVCIVLLYRHVVLPLGVPEFTIGIAGYFSAADGVLCLAVSILLFATSHKQRTQRSSPVAESKVDIYFKSSSAESRKEHRLRHLSSDEFFVGYTEEDGEEEWGYSPLVTDAKEVRFEVYASDESEDGVYPEVMTYDRGIKIAEGSKVEDLLSASNSQANNFQRKLTEDPHLIISTEENNASDRFSQEFDVQKDTFHISVSETHALIKPNCESSLHCSDKSHMKKQPGIHSNQDRVEECHFQTSDGNESEKLPSGFSVSGDLRGAGDIHLKTSNDETTEVTNDEASEHKFLQEHESEKEVKIDLNLSEKVEKKTRDFLEMASCKKIKRLRTASESTNIEQVIRDIINNFGRDIELDIAPIASNIVNFKTESSLCAGTSNSTFEQYQPVWCKEMVPKDYSEAQDSETKLSVKAGLLAAAGEKNSAAAVKSDISSLGSDNNKNEMEQDNVDDLCAEKEEPSEISPVEKKV